MRLRLSHHDSALSLCSRPDDLALLVRAALQDVPDNLIDRPMYVGQILMTEVTFDAT